MRRRKTKSIHKGEEGVVVLLVAMFLLFVVGAMAALAVDLVTFYTARSEAQQAADGAALAAARVLANSGMTSADASVWASAEDLARTVATQVAVQNKVGGGIPTVSISFNEGDPDFQRNPHVIVQVSRTDLPVFFSRILGNTAATVRATATAEAYNPSGANTTSTTDMPSVALTCVKPWLLPNLDPTGGGGQIFDPNTGAITNPGMLGTNSSKSPGFVPGTLISRCPNGNCIGVGSLPAQPWQYYPGKQTSFPAPTQSLPSCPTIGTPSAYQLSIAGCVQVAITCQSGALNNVVDIDTIDFPARAQDTADAVNCLTHAATTLGDGDVADPGSTPNPAPFTYIGGTKNPIPGTSGKQLMVSDSLVTVPVIDETSLPFTSTGNSAKVIGFVQLFLNADGGPAPNVDPAPIQTKIVNMIGCGNNATANPIQGNGTSAVTVRLIAPQ